MVFFLLAKPSPTRVLLMAPLHHASSPAAMAAPRLSSSLNRELFKSATPSKVGSVSLQSRSFNGLAEHSVSCNRMLRNIVRLHADFSRTAESDVGDSHMSLGFPSLDRRNIWKSQSSMKQRCFCTSSGAANTGTSYTQNQPPYPTGSNASNAGCPPYPAGSTGYPQKPQQSTYSPGNNPPGYASGQPGYVPSTGPPSGSNPVSSSSQSPGYMPSTGPPPRSSPAGGASSGSNSPPRTSAAAEVIDKYLGPSTLKLEKQDNKAPPPPPPRRNYGAGAQGTQEKKSGKDLVAESAACAVIEKYLGPWPGFPPRDPKIDEYLDSLPENAACAAIDKYFGPYKPLFVFKKKEENPDNPPPPSRPPRNRMMSRARNRSWNASQQGASVDRPWTAPQQGSNPNVTGPSPQGVGVTASQGASPMPSPPSGVGGMPSPSPMQGAPPVHGSPSSYAINMPAPQGSGEMPPPQGGSDMRQ